MSEAERQENVDRFYWMHGPCCAGCDWWQPLNPVVGSCTAAKIVSGRERADALGIDKCSLRIPSGHPITRRDYICGQFEDKFDWSSLPLPYRKRVGDPTAL